jgi:hypothetical protein
VICVIGCFVDDGNHWSFLSRDAFNRTVFVGTTWMLFCAQAVDEMIWPTFVISAVFFGGFVAANVGALRRQ